MDTERSMACWIGFAGIVILAEFGFLGNGQTQLWSLTAIALNIVVLYALRVHWVRASPRSVRWSREMTPCDVACAQADDHG